MIGIILVINLSLLAYVLYTIVGLHQRIYDLEDHIHAIYHDIDMKIEKGKVEPSILKETDGEKN